MSLTVTLKLKLSKVVKKIVVKYNTFDKATYDEYLMSSLALNSKYQQEAYEYIDEISGDGSLNSHFKNLYNDIVEKLSLDELKKVMNNSMFPILKIDDRNCYDYYPDFDVSVFQKHVFDGDFAEVDNLVAQLGITEDVIDLKVEDVRLLDKPESYEVLFRDAGSIAVKLYGAFIDISENLFQEMLVDKLDSFTEYTGTIHAMAEGSGWYILNKSVINNMFAQKNYFYSDDGDHMAIRNENVRRTEVARLGGGLYIYRESIMPYESDKKLCLRTLITVWKSGIFRNYKPQFIAKLLRQVDVEPVVKFINMCYTYGELPKEIAAIIIELLRRGTKEEWNAEILCGIMKYCSTEDYSLIYRSNPNIGFKISQLILIDRSLLKKEHYKQVSDYFANLNKMKLTIKEITGEITVSGLREKVKILSLTRTQRSFQNFATI